MKTNGFKLWLIAGLLAGSCVAAEAVSTNSWSDGTGKWELGSNWSLGVAPSTNGQTTIVITNAGGNVVTVDATTVLSNAINGCLNVTNLTINGNTLALTNAGTVTPLQIIGPSTAFRVGSGGKVVISNSFLKIRSQTPFMDGSLLLDGGLLIVTNSPVVPTLYVGFTTPGSLVLSNGMIVASNLEIISGSFQMAGGTNIVERLFENFGSTLINGGTVICTSTISAVRAQGQTTVSNGTVLVNRLDVGSVYNSSGTLTLAGGSVDGGEQMFVGGLFGASALTGTVWMVGLSPVLTVTNGTTMIGSGGIGRFTVSNGVWRARDVEVGSVATSQGSLTVVGGVVTVSSNLTIGGRGTLTLAGGTVTLNSLVASNSTGRIRFDAGNLTVSNSTRIVNGISFTVGENGTGTAILNLSGGTHEWTNSLLVGQNATGQVWLSGGQLLVSNAAIALGFVRVGQMTISNGTLLVRDLVAGYGPGASGALNLAGGTNFVTGLLSVAGVFGGATGAVSVAAGVSSVYSNLTIGQYDCSGVATVNVTGGELRVTNATGNAVLEVRSGTLTQSGGTLSIDRLVITNACGRFIHTGGTLATSTNMLAGAFDADGDGLPNDWEQQHGLDPFDPTGNDGGAGDPDGDGFTNLQEYLTGTDPNVHDFRITAIARESDNVRITWSTVGGNTNRVLVSPGAEDGSYTNAFSNLSPVIFVAGTGATSTNYLDTGGATNTPSRYYTVVRGLGFASGARFLFDAGHAETAGNADWVIDADLHNITWNSSGTFTISGNDSNAQRIPTPAASGIISNTVETYWQGGISAWAVDLVKRGHSVETLPAGATFTYNTANSQDLTNYNVVVVNEPNILFTLTEKQALLSFVSNGGSLFMIADHTSSDRNGDGVDSPVIWMDFLTNNLVTNNPFGIIFPSSNASGTNTFNHNIVGDPILNGPVGLATNTAYFSGNRFQIDHTKNPTVISHMWFGTAGQSNTLCAVASLLYGNGRVVVCGDSSPFEDGTGDPGDSIFNGYTEDLGDTNRIWILNASEWLAEP